MTNSIRTGQFWSPSHWKGSPGAAQPLHLSNINSPLLLLLFFRSWNSQKSQVNICQLIYISQGFLLGSWIRAEHSGLSFFYFSGRGLTLGSQSSAVCQCCSQDACVGSYMDTLARQFRKATGFQRQQKPDCCRSTDS